LSAAPGLSDDTIEVVAAVVSSDDLVLLCQRHDGPHLPLLWEFPGGKIDCGETPPAALERELSEELDVAADIGPELACVRHGYPEKRVRIRFFAALIRGEPRPVVHREIRWVPVSALSEYEVPPANQAVVDMLIDAGSAGLDEIRKAIADDEQRPLR